MTIKLFLYFIAMDLLILMAYPIVFVHGKLRWLSKEIERSRPSQMVFKEHKIIRHAQGQAYDLKGVEK